MTKKHFTTQLQILVARLCDAGNNFGFRSDEYNAVIDEIHEFASRIDHSRRPRPWIVLTILWVLLAILAWLCYEFLCLPKT